MKVKVGGVAKAPVKAYNINDVMPSGLYHDVMGALFLAANDYGAAVYFRIYEDIGEVVPVKPLYPSWPLTSAHAGFSVTFTQE